jgi:glycosyltransferase involved in cell wall biosynthesis
VLDRRAAASRELELGLVRATDVTLVVSDTERALLRELVPPARVEVLSNVHEVSCAPATPEGRSGLLFVGSFDHLPNRDAAVWLAEEIMPLVRKRVSDAVLHLVGSNPPAEITALAGEGVVVHGWVPDLEPLYGSARLTIAPLRFGAGVKGKVGESLARGIPVVGSTLAFEGMRLRHAKQVQIGDTAEELAEQTVLLLTDDALWRRLSDSGREAVAAQFGGHVARTTLVRLLAAGGITIA